LGFLEVNGVANTVDISPYIGPPIRGIYKQLTGETSDEKVEQFGMAFQKNYDAEGYKKSVMYDGFDELFDELQSRSIILHIATYKRHFPTIKILENLNLISKFDGIYSVDKFGFNYENKAVMVKDLLEKHQILPAQTIFVGDTHHDRIAALENNIIFAFAKYGYGSMDDAEIVLEKPLELLKIL
jgi:phosphoglycolate phosphatase